MIVEGVSHGFVGPRETIARAPEVFPGLRSSVCLKQFLLNNFSFLSSFIDCDRLKDVNSVVAPLVLSTTAEVFACACRI
jgi:hypothetical protein